MGSEMCIRDRVGLLQEALVDAILNETTRVIGRAVEASGYSDNLIRIANNVCSIGDGIADDNLQIGGFTFDFTGSGSASAVYPDESPRDEQGFAVDFRDFNLGFRCTDSGNVSVNVIKNSCTFLEEPKKEPISFSCMVFTEL